MSREDATSASWIEMFNSVAYAITGFALGAAIVGGIVVLRRSKRFWGRRVRAVVGDHEK